jgi:predicted AAA+ superfamily ATPase
VLQRTETLTYWRSQNGHEVDFVIVDGQHPKLAIEIKSKINPSDRDFGGIRALKEEFSELKCGMVCQTFHDLLRDDGTHVFSVDSFLNKLWGGQLLGEA